MGDVTSRAAERGSEQGHPGEQRHMQPDQASLRDAQAAHHGAGIEMALHVAVGRLGNRDRGEDHGQQRGEAEKALRPVKGAANFGARVGGVLESLAAAETRFDPGAEAGDGARLAGHHQPVSDARPGLDEAGRRKVVEVHQQARGQAEEIDAAIGFESQDCGHRQALPAELHGLPGT